MLVLDDPTTWPEDLIAALADDTVTAELEKLEYVENHDPRGAVANVLSTVDDSVKSHGIAGFHCTKEPFPGFFSERGLRVLEMETHHREVLKWLESDLSPEVLARAQDRLAGFAASDQRPGRDGKLYFCLSRTLLEDSGTDRLFTYLGGEAVYGCLWQDPEIAPVLEAKGRPVIVEAALEFPEMRPGVGQVGLGLSLVSHHAVQSGTSPKMALYEVETWVGQPISAERIVAVHSYDDFRTRWGQGRESQ